MKRLWPQMEQQNYLRTIFCQALATYMALLYSFLATCVLTLTVINRIKLYIKLLYTKIKYVLNYIKICIK